MYGSLFIRNYNLIIGSFIKAEQTPMEASHGMRSGFLLENQLFLK